MQQGVGQHHVLVLQIIIQLLDLLVYECALLGVLDAQEMGIINVMHARRVIINYQHCA